MRRLQTGFKSDAFVERIKTNSVLNPLLWLCGVVEVLAIPAAALSTNGAQTILFLLAGLPVIATILAYFIWMVCNPERLQSEEYQLARQQILQGSKEEDSFLITTQTSDHPPRRIITTEEALTPDEPSSDNDINNILPRQSE